MRLSKDRSAGFILGYITRQAHKYFNTRFTGLGLPRGAVYILKCLYKEDGINQQKICDWTHLDKANVTRALAELEKRKFVRRKVDTQDQRAKLIYLSKKAKDFAGDFRAVYTEWEDRLLNGFSEEELPIVKDILYRIALNVGTSGRIREKTHAEDSTTCR